MKLTNSRIEIGVLRLGNNDSAIEKMTLDLIHNGADADLKKAVEEFVNSNPPEINETYFTVFCLAMEMEKEDGGVFMSYGVKDVELWMGMLN